MVYFSYQSWNQYPGWQEHPIFCHRIFFWPAPLEEYPDLYPKTWSNHRGQSWVMFNLTLGAQTSESTKTSESMSQGDSFLVQGVWGGGEGKGLSQKPKQLNTRINNKLQLSDTVSRGRKQQPGKLLLLLHSLLFLSFSLFLHLLVISENMFLEQPPY